MSSKQFYILFCISIITMKMQKLPTLVSGELGKDGWLLFLGFALINIVLICLVFVIIKRVDPKIVLNSSNNLFFNILRIILLLATTVYFLVQAILVYEHIQGLFANTLFDNLSWPIYSLFLLFTVFFLAHRGIDNIALNTELYTWIIIIPFVLLAILGIKQCDFSAILPFQTTDFKLILSKLKTFNCWFGDFFLVLYLGIKVKDIKLSKTLLTYVVSMLFMTFLMVEFTGIYQSFAGMQPGLITELSEHSLLDMSIGRVDWFLILLTEVGAILNCAVNLYFANLCLRSVFPKAKSMYIKIFNAVVLYFLDVFVMVDINAKKNFFCGVMSNISIAIEVFTLVVLLFIALNNSFKKNKMQGLDLSSQNNNLEKIKKKSETKKQNQALELKRGEINFRKKLGEKEKIAEKKNLKDIENASNGKVKDKLTRNKQENQQSKQIHRNQSQSKQIHQKDEISFEEVKKETKTKEVRNEKNKAKPTKKRGAEL